MALSTSEILILPHVWTQLYIVQNSDPYTVLLPQSPCNYHEVSSHFSYQEMSLHGCYGTALWESVTEAFTGGIPQVPQVKGFNTFRTKTPKYLLPGGNKPLLYHQIGNINFFIFINKSIKLDVLCRQNKIWTFGNPFQSKSCQFAPTIVIFNLCICCQFEDSQIISPKIIPVSHRNI